MINNAVKREYRRLLEKWNRYKTAMWLSERKFYHQQYKNLEYWARRDVEAFEQKINWR